jgi:hypothetical protein
MRQWHGSKPADGCPDDAVSDHAGPFTSRGGSLQVFSTSPSASWRSPISFTFVGRLGAEPLALAEGDAEGGHASFPEEPEANRMPIGPSAPGRHGWHAAWDRMDGWTRFGSLLLVLTLLLVLSAWRYRQRREAASS